MTWDTARYFQKINIVVYKNINLENPLKEKLNFQKKV